MGEFLVEICSNISNKCFGCNTSLEVVRMHCSAMEAARRGRGLGWCDEGWVWRVQEGPGRGRARTVVLTGMSLLERRPETYEVAERHPLGALAALVRFQQEPTWLGLEWSDGAPASTYVLPARDALLVALLDAAQARPLARPALPCTLIPTKVPG